MRQEREGVTAGAKHLSGREETGFRRQMEAGAIHGKRRTHCTVTGKRRRGHFNSNIPYWS